MLRIDAEFALRWIVWWEHLWHDVRTAVRAVARRPVATGAAIVALAVGMGGPAAFIAIVLTISTAVFPGVREPNQLVMVWETPPREPGQRRDVSADTLRVWRANAAVVPQLSAAQPSVSLNLRVREIPESVRVQAIAVDLLPLLGVSSAEGRGFQTADDDPNAEPVALVSDGFAARRASGRDGIIGSAIDLDGRSVTIVGVMPIGFWFGSRDVDIWMPIPERDENPDAQYRVVARLPSGDDAAALSARLGALAPQVAAAQPAREPDWGVRTESLGRQPLFAGGMPPGVLMLIAAATLGLLAACANIAMVMIARGVARQKETAVRSALGAARGRLIRQFLTESLVVSMTGGAGALFIVYAVYRILVASAPPDLSAAIDVALDWRLVAAVIAVSLLVGVLSGLAPALTDSRVHLVAALKETGYFGGAPARSRLRRTLIVAEVTITVMLMANIALLINGVHNLERTNPGFDVEHLIAVQLESVQHVGRAPTPPPDADLLVERLSAVGGVVSVAAARTALPRFAVHDASETYFSTLGLRVIQGRPLTVADRTAATVVVSQAFAQSRFPGKSALGETIEVGDETSRREIVGVVSDVMAGGLGREPVLAVYIPYSGPGTPTRGSVTLLVRTASDASVVSDLRRAVAAINPLQTIASVMVLKEMMAVGAQEVRVSIYFTTPILVLAVLLAMTGIYGLLAQTVSQRTHELAVRVALGAGRRDVLHLIAGQGLKLAAAGALFGSAGALALDRALGAFLFGVPAEQSLALAGTALVIMAVTLAASIAPCRRALHIDPGKTLKYE